MMLNFAETLFWTAAMYCNISSTQIYDNLIHRKAQFTHFCGSLRTVIYTSPVSEAAHVIHVPTIQLGPIIKLQNYQGECCIHFFLIGDFNMSHYWMERKEFKNGSLLINSTADRRAFVIVRYGKKISFSLHLSPNLLEKMLETRAFLTKINPNL